MAHISTLGQALSIIDRIKDQQTLFSDLTTQLGTGKKTQTYSGLGSDVLITKRARADIRAIENYESNITKANTRLELTTGTISAFKQQSNDFYDLMAGLSIESVHQQGSIVYWDDPATTDVEEAIEVGYDSGDSDTDFTTVQNFAASTYDYLSDLLNTQQSERYLFSGTDTLTQPLDDNGTLDAAITQMIADWKDGTITNDELIANIVDRTTDGGNSDAITDSLIGYSATLSSDSAEAITIRVDDATEITYEAFANDEAFRDVLVITAVLKSADLGPIADEVEIDETTGLPVVLTDGAPGTTVDEMRTNFFTVYNALVTELYDAIEKIDNVSFDLENTRVRIDRIAEDFTNEKSLLINTVSDIENVDLNEVAVELQVLETQLVASYNVSSLLQNLSLVNFI